MDMNRMLEELRSKIVSGNLLTYLIISHAETGLFWKHQHLVLVTACRECVCVFASIHLEGFICLGLEVQGTDQRCFVEDVIFLCQVPSTILQYESPSLSN